jgi:hypothetical protein
MQKTLERGLKADFTKDPDHFSSSAGNRGKAYRGKMVLEA